MVSCRRSTGSICSGPAINAAVVSPTVVVLSTPDDHFIAGPDRSLTMSASGRIDRVGGRPTVSPGIIPPAGVIISTPDDHFTAGPYRRVRLSRRGRNGARSCPTVRTRIVSRAAI